MSLCIVIGALFGALAGWLVKKLKAKWRMVLLSLAALFSLIVAVMVVLRCDAILPFILTPLYFLLAMALQLRERKGCRDTPKQLYITSWVLLSAIVSEYRVELASLFCVPCKTFIVAVFCVYVFVGSVLCLLLLHRSKNSLEKEYCWFMYWLGLILLYSHI